MRIVFCPYPSPSVQLNYNSNAGSISGGQVNEARHVRFLIKAGYLSAKDWLKIRELPRNRVDAWEQINPVRIEAQSESSAEKTAGIFQEKFGKSLVELLELYNNPNWRHAKASGGHKWRDVTSILLDLRKAISDHDLAGIESASTTLLSAEHNNGPLKAKITELNRDIGVTTDPWWLDE